MVCNRVNNEVLVALHFLAPCNVFTIDQRPFSRARGSFVEGSVAPSNKGGSKTLSQLCPVARNKCHQWIKNPHSGHQSRVFHHGAVYTEGYQDD